MPVQDRGFPQTFEHPANGASTLEPTLLAVRWATGADAAAKAALVDGLGLEEATTDDESRRPAVAVNRTDGLWWLRAADGAEISDDALDALAGSDLVEWVAPGYRAPGGSGQESRAAAAAPSGAVFAVNPTRLYVARSAAQADDLEAVEAAPSTARASRVPGYDLVAVRAGTSITAAEQLGRRAAERAGDRGQESRRGTPADVRFETIPFLSPTCSGGHGGGGHGGGHGGGDGAAVAVRGRCAPPQAPFTPDDPQFAAQWGLARMEVPRAWQIARGAPDVVVAVIDEGVELGHPDLSLHPQSWNASSDTPDGGPVGNHGTACAGIVAARLDNGQGVAGVAGGSRVMAIATSTWADVDIAEGLYFAADHGARVVSMSFGVYPEWGVWDFDLIRDALQYAADQGLLLVAAAGNEDQPVARFPGSDARTLCVGGSNRSDERKRGGDSSAEPWWGASYGPDVDVVAPCLEIPTTDRLGGDGYDPGDYAPGFNGTSAATPHVAGLGALLFSLRPGLDAAEARRIIESTCDKISPSLYAYGNVPTKPSGTWNEEVGYGRVNAERALLAACAGAEGEGDACGDCSGCGGCCEQPIDPRCAAPEPVPWLPFDQCQFFYEARVFGLERAERLRLELRVGYEHCLRLLGQQQGPLLYSTTLLPGETVDLYEFDRYRRVRSQEERMSVHASFRQTLSALSQTRRFSSATSYASTLAQARVASDLSVSAGGGLVGFFGGPSVSGETQTSVETTLASGSSVTTVGEQFTQNAVTASQSTEAERSVVISSFEDAEHQQTTRRSLRNDNPCHAVTYLVRRILEVYMASSRVTSVEWRVGDLPWRNVDDAPDDVRQFLDKLADRLPRPGEQRQDPRPVTVPTDGTLYEAQLAHCSSCDPIREAMLRIDVEQRRQQARRACLENAALEAQRPA